MPSHSLPQEAGPRSPVRHGSSHGLITLGLFHFWLLMGILGGMLALFVLVFAAHLLSLSTPAHLR
jgi:hypothetical protein